MNRTLSRWLPIIILIVILILAIVFKWYRYLSFDVLSENHLVLTHWRDQHYAAAVFLFSILYIIAVAISIPGATILTLIGGFLFGILAGSVYVVISATIGACLIFLAVRTAVGEWLQAKARGWIAKMEKGFQQNDISYLLFLRLVPIFPFWVVNIVPALLNMKLSRFLIGTFLGIIPGSIVYAAVGNGLNAVFEQGGKPNLGIIFEPKILVPILLLALLSLVPIIYNKLKQKRGAAS